MPVALGSRGMVGRLALVVHPSRPLDEALQTLRGWAERHDADVVQLELPPGGRQVAELAGASPCDVVVALGGDGTVLAALRAAAKVDAPVLGVACGSLGALTATAADDIEGALERFAAGDWTARRLPALSIESDAGAAAWAINDFVVSRGATGQLVAEISLDGELYVRMAGDGVVVSTVLGSSAYSMAAGGPLLAAGADVFVCTPIAMHGGSAPPLVAPGDATLSVLVHPGFSRFGSDIDGQPHRLEGDRFEIRRHPGKVRLVAFSEATGHGLEGLRARGLLADSPRVLARDRREKLHEQLPR